MTIRIGNIAFDCDDVLRVANFWSTVLEGPLDEGSSDLFASIGGTDGERRNTGVVLHQGAQAQKRQEPRTPRSGEP